MDKLKLIEVEKTVDTIPFGRKAYYSKTITEGDVALFAGITGDFAPISTSREFAECTQFPDRLVQTMLVASFSWPVSSEIASPGAVTITQECYFYKPVFIGDTITCVGEVTEKIPEKKIVIVRTTCYNQHDEMVMDGSVVELMRVH